MQTTPGNYFNDLVANTRQGPSISQQANINLATSSDLSNQNSSSSILVRLPPPPSSLRGTNSNTLNRQTLNKTDYSSAFGPPTQHPDLKLSQQSYTPLLNQPLKAQKAQTSSHQAAAFGDNISISSSSSSSSSSRPAHRHMASSMFGSNNFQQQQLIDTADPPSKTTTNDSCRPAGTTTTTTTTSLPFITSEPQAQWNSDTKQLTWKFDNLLSYYKTDGYGSLLAKLDFRNHHGVLPSLFMNQQAQAEPGPVDVKFMIVDSTLSKVNMSIDTTGYRMSLLKKEIRSGRYKSEPYVF